MSGFSTFAKSQRQVHGSKVSLLIMGVFGGNMQKTNQSVIS